MEIDEKSQENNRFRHQSVTSKNTSINGSKLPKVFRLVESKYGWEPATTNLDIGGGRYDNASDFLSNLGVTNLIFDPFNRDVTHNNNVMKKVGHKKADTVTLSNVLCVIPEKDIQNQLIQMAYENLKPYGILYLTIYEGDGQGVGRMTGNDQWQEHRKLADYRGQVESVFGRCEIRYGMIRAIKEN